MSTAYDDLERRSPEARAAAEAQALPVQVARALGCPGFAAHLKGVNPGDVTSREALAKLPVLRKSALSAAQQARPPFGGFVSVNRPDHVFRSPGPILEPGMRSHDWWRLGRFAHAAGIGADDIVQNCFSYHFTPAGMMFENAAAAVGASIFPAGTGQSEAQAEAAAEIGTTAYAGTPDFLKVILEKADALGLSLSIRKALVSGGPLFPALRGFYEERGISCIQCYATADIGLIAYETEAQEGMIVDDGVIVEIVTPGTGDPVAQGELGEVVVTSLNPDYPLIRFATGDISGELPGQSPCGRTNMRIVGWRGRADQAAKVKGMFVRPEQVAQIVERLPEVQKARLTITEEGGLDTLHVALEARHDGPYAEVVRDVLKLRAEVETVLPGALPRDGVVIDDKRNFE